MESISRCCHNFYVQPFDRQKVLYICGAIGGVVLVVVVILTVTMMSGGSSSSGEPVKGSDALKNSPFIVGFNNLPGNLKVNTKNQLSKYNFSIDVMTNAAFNSCTTCQTDYPRLKAGKVATQLWTVDISCDALNKDAVTQTIEQIDLIQRFMAMNPSKLMPVSAASDINEGFKKNLDFIGSLISINGGHTIDGRLGVLRLFYQLGVRAMALTSNCNTSWAMNSVPIDPKTGDTGMTSFGENVVKEMNRLGMIVDLSGTSYQTQLKVLGVTKAPVIFSHGGSAAIYDDTNKLNVKDDVLTKLKENGGLVMVTFSSAQLQVNVTNASLSDVISHLNDLKTKVGAEHIGIGGAYDFYSAYPVGLQNISATPSLFDTLYTEHKWTLAELEGLAGNNFITLLTAVEKVSKDMIGTAVDETLEPMAEYPATAACYSDFNIRY